ncbi:uncharacterized protein LOC116769644 isoform X2 [Danaus plexippus]|uniref:uncharacterized protein LOC116769644 isoform X2 n=1 Tax=Danaus plexippus TaxID=13037 RepID=UPI002AB1DAC5|nr:uncharacterized protein LOC116769644 isoform X2 [Danaus plexippus]
MSNSDVCEDCISSAEALCHIKVDQNATEIYDSTALRNLEKNTKQLDAIFIEDDIDDCSIYKRLTRKCHCLNHPTYNDFIIQFNEVTRYTTSCIGEIIKNMKILKKFLYMGGDYTKNALIFLNEGLIDCKPKEKVEISQGCTHADICSIFDEHSIIVTCISWPCKYKGYGDFVTQNLAANFVYKLAEIEEGRRYLNYSSKISNDIRKVLRKKSAVLEVDTLDTLNSILNLLKPTFIKNMALTYFTKSIYEGIGKRTICDLMQYRQYMIRDEVLMNLDTLKDYSYYDYGKKELLENLPALFTLMKHILVEYDDSQLNIVITNILNNIVVKKIIQQDDEKKRLSFLLTHQPSQLK